jgi:hypothetical protein
MFKVSKKTDYALLALQDLAGPGEPGDLSARVTAERFEIPLELLAKILQRLARHVVDIGALAESRSISVSLQKQETERTLAGRTR